MNLFTDVQRPWYSPLRWLSVPYEAAVHLRRLFYRRGVLSSRHVDVPVISVGGVTVGGSGKTPTVIWTVEQIRRMGLKAAVVSRGYGGRPGHDPYVVCDGHVRRADVKKCGDEPVLITAKAPESIVVVHPDRVNACECARGLGAQIIVLDDGLQHKRLARDLDIVLVDAREPFGNGCFLPAGPLRDAPEAMRTAGLVLLTRAEEATPEELQRSRDLVAKVAPEAVVATARYELEAPAELMGKRVFAVSGIARPETFVEALEHAGLEVAGAHAFRDHHIYDADDLATVQQEAERAGADVIVTTEKDATRLPEGGEVEGERPIVPVALHIDVEETARRYLRGRIKAWFPSARVTAPEALG